MLLFFIIILLLILTVYIFYRLGLLNVLQIFFLGLLCILSMIIIYLLLCPTTIKNYIFFQGNLHTVLTNVPVEIIDQTRINALSEINNPNTGQILSNLTNNLVDILSQKPADNSTQLETQTKLLTSMDENLSAIRTNTENANIIAEVSLEQYSNGQNLALNKLASLNNSINTQTKELKVVINNPIGVIDGLNSINFNVKPTIKMLGELNEINYKLGQEKQLLSEGFNKLLQSEGYANLGKELQNLSVNLDKKLALHQENVIKGLEGLNDQYNLDRQETRNLLEKMQISSLADIEIMREEAEKKIQAAENMANYYRKHEALGQANSSSGINASKIDANSVNQAAAGVGLVSALTWALKFLRVI